MAGVRNWQFTTLGNIGQKPLILELSLSKSLKGRTGFGSRKLSVRKPSFMLHPDVRSPWLPSVNGPLKMNERETAPKGEMPQQNQRQPPHVLSRKRFTFQTQTTSNLSPSPGFAQALRPLLFSM